MSRIEQKERLMGKVALILLGLFLGGGATVFLAMRTFISIDTLFLLFLTLGGLFTAVYLLVSRRSRQAIIDTAVLCFIGWGSLALAALMGTNYAVHGEAKEIFIAREALGRDEGGPVIRSGTPMTDSLFAQYPYLLHTEKLESLGVEELKQVEGFRVRIADGFFGYPVVLKKEIVFKNP